MRSRTAVRRIEQELLTLPWDYSPPRGCLLLVTEGKEGAGSTGVGLLDKPKRERTPVFVSSHYLVGGSEEGHLSVTLRNVRVACPVLAKYLRTLRTRSHRLSRFVILRRMT